MQAHFVEEHAKVWARRGVKVVACLLPIAILCLFFYVLGQRDVEGLKYKLRICAGENYVLSGYVEEQMLFDGVGQVERLKETLVLGNHLEQRIREVKR